MLSLAYILFLPIYLNPQGLFHGKPQDLFQFSAHLFVGDPAGRSCKNRLQKIMHHSIHIHDLHVDKMENLSDASVISAPGRHNLWGNALLFTIYLLGILYLGDELVILNTLISILGYSVTLACHFVHRFQLWGYVRFACKLAIFCDGEWSQSFECREDDLIIQAGMFSVHL